MKYISASFCLLLILIVFGLKAQNSPVFTLGTVSTTASAVTLPVTAVGFSNIASGDLKIVYDPEVAIPSKVTLGPGMTGTFAYNLNNKGIVKIGWFTYPSVSLADSSVVFSIEFARISHGTSRLSFNDVTASPGDCQFYDGSYQKLNDEPFSSYYLPGSLTFTEPAGPVTTAPALIASPNEDIAVPITVIAFNDVGAVSLVLEYDPAVLEFSSAENSGGFPGLTISNPVPGTITVSGTLNTPDGYSIPDETVFFTLNFRYLGGTTTLSWNDDDGSSCEYEGPLSAYVFTDTPRSEYYHNGKVGQVMAPVAPAVRLTHPTCAASTGEIEVTSPLGAEYTYSIDGTEYQSSAAFSDLFSGSYNVTVRNEEGHISQITTAVIEKQPHIPVTPAVEITAPTCQNRSSATITNYNPEYTYSFSPMGPAIGTGGEIAGFITGQPYLVTATSNDGCESAPSVAFITADTLEAPEPIIVSEHTEEGRVILTASEGESYLWSTGETTQNIEATTTGEYTVEVTYKNGCSALSSATSIIISSALSETVNGQVEIKAYPNPFPEQLKIEFISPESSTACVEIYDMTGRLVKVVFNQQVEAGIMYTAEFKPATETGGNYTYRINLGGSVHTGLVIYKK